MVWVKLHMVIEHHEKPVPQNFSDFFITLAIRTVVALDELHVQQRRFLGVEITVQDQVVIVNAEEFLVVKIHSSPHVFMCREEFGLGEISIQTKFFSRACM